MNEQLEQLYRRQLDQLFRKRAKGLQRYVRIRVGAQASEDIVQDSFELLYHAMAKEMGIGDHWAYLKGIARHLIAQHYGRDAGRPQSIPLLDDLAITELRGSW
jgi:DNA-directed RNA polymerase specialized sigma24 family protein